MALCDLKYYSRSLSKMMACNILLPEGVAAQTPFSCLYLLHGLSDDYTGWARKSRIEKYVEESGRMVVMPDGGRSFYLDAVRGPAYESHFISDLIPYIDRIFPTVRGPEGRFVGGLSMGGYGALHYALKYPEMFGAAFSHSGALGFAHTNKIPGPVGEVEFENLVGAEPAGSEADLFALAGAVAGKPLPRLLIDCGVDDHLVEDNRAFHAHLTSLGIAHEYVEHPGAHTWDYWDRHVRDGLRFIGF